MPNWSIWIGQATTGTGFATLLAALSGITAGSLTWQQALPLVFGGLAGLIWPERPELRQQAAKAAQDLSALVGAIRESEMSHPVNAQSTANGTKPVA